MEIDVHFNSTAPELQSVPTEFNAMVIELSAETAERSSKGFCVQVRDARPLLPGRWVQLNDDWVQLNDHGAQLRRVCVQLRHDWAEV